MIREITEKILSLAKITCPNCNTGITLDNYSKEEKMFKCPNCSSIFAAGSTLQRNTGTSFAPRSEIAMPGKISISHSEGYYIITRKWFGLKFIVLLFFTLFWDGFMIVWHFISISTGQYVMSAFGLIHTAAGLFITYLTVTGLINKTDIKIGRGKIIIRHRPLWWPGSREYSAAMFDQFFSTEKISHSKNGTTYTYELKGRTYDGSVIKIVGGLENSNQALFLEQKMENFLGITDSPVSGEISR
ncbi:MAG: hypothetical protein JW982_00285 [Spirochaetes bacterium]|nr:hypothetical protein [Spirochaetota bacterium]